jgi:hypothetical protein
MDHKTRCLAGTNHCNVLQCSCGMLHVTLGPITMRVDPRAGATLHEVLGEALDRLAMEAPGSQVEARRPDAATDTGKPAPLLRLASSRGDDLPS